MQLIGDRIVQFLLKYFTTTNMKIQLWIATFVPPLVPDWVNPNITIDYDRNYKRFFIFEIDPGDEVFIRCKTPDRKATSILKVCGFKRPKRIYQGLAEEFFLDNSGYPPLLSSLMTMPMLQDGQTC